MWIKGELEKEENVDKMDYSQSKVVQQVDDSLMMIGGTGSTSTGASTTTPNKAVKSQNGQSPQSVMVVMVPVDDDATDGDVVVGEN